MAHGVQLYLDGTQATGRKIADEYDSTTAACFAWMVYALTATGLVEVLRVGRKMLRSIGRGLLHLAALLCRPIGNIGKRVI